MVAVQWYPGHMEKTRRQMEESLKAVDCVIEVRDCRIPLASRNPLLEEMAARKPRLIVLTRLDLADPQKTALWLEALASDGTECLALDLSKDASAGKKVVSRCLALCQPKIEKMKARGIRPRAMRAMAAGIPNVGKSTLINRVAVRKDGGSGQPARRDPDPEMDSGGSAAAAAGHARRAVAEVRRSAGRIPAGRHRRHQR
jgi:ribosome biogenesis GTPase A